MNAALDALAFPLPARLAIALSCGPGGAIEVTRLELRTDELSVVVTDRGGVPLWDQLDTPLRDLLAGLAERHGEGEGLAVAPTVSLRIGQLCLTGCRVLATRSTRGRRSLIVQFSYVAGDLGGLFAGGRTARPERTRAPARIAELTANVLMPLRDLYAHLDALGGALAPAELARQGRRFLDRVFREKLSECEAHHVALLRHLDAPEPGRAPARGAAAAEGRPAGRAC